jgi:hypothetical protein
MQVSGRHRVGEHAGGAVAWVGWFGVWGAVGFLAGAAHAVEISELMYHPPRDVAGELTDTTGEFLELHHGGGASIDLTGWAFDRGITYVFPPGSVIGPGGYVVLARDPAAFSVLHGLPGVYGPYEGALSNEGERLRLLDEAGRVRLDFRYGVGGDWPAAAAGAGHSMVLAAAGADPGSPRNWRASRWVGGSPGLADPDETSGGAETFLVPQDAVARYFKGWREPSGGTTGWTAPGFELDGDWLEGQGGFGYSNDPAELAAIRTVLSDMRNNYVSVYARYGFVLSAADPGRMEALMARVTYDDGYVLYLNGVRVAAVNVTGAPPAFDTLANSSTDYLPEEHDLTAHRGLLREGLNVLAIQGHNGLLGGSSDFVLAPELWARWAPERSEEERLRRVRINEFLANSEGEMDWVELYNPDDDPVDLSGVWLSDRPWELARYALPAGTAVPGRGFLVLHQADFEFGLSSEGEAIFLTEPGLSFVVDGYAYGPQRRGVSLGRHPDGGWSWYELDPPSPGVGNAPRRLRPVIINELMYHAPGGARDDYLELWNSGEEDVDLSGWRFEGIQFEFPAGVGLPAGGLLVLADQPPSAARTYGLPEGVLWRYRGSLSNSGERVTLLDAADVVVDTVAYRDRAPWPVTPDGLGASLERSCVSDRFDDPADWRASPLDAPTPLRPNTAVDCVPQPPVPVVINEIMYRPYAELDDERRTEFIELFNHGLEAVELTGWGLSGDVRFQFPAGAVLGPGEYLLLAWDPERVVGLYGLEAARVLGPYSPGLSNGGGRVVLYGADGRVVDAVRYDDDFPWPSLADGHGRVEGVGRSLERRLPAGSSADPANWDVSLEDAPTPLARNHRWTAILPPTVVALEVTPAEVTPADTPVVRATLAGARGYSAVRIEYWVDDAELENEGVVSRGMQLVVNGDEDEEEDGERVWECLMPALPANSIVRYRVSVMGAGGWDVVSPRPDADVYGWHGYFVDPGVGTALPGGVYHLFLSSSNWRLLHDSTAAGRVSGSQPNPTWNLQVPAVFVAEGVVHDVTVRHQGSRWNRNGGSTIAFGCASHRTDGQAQVRSWRIRFPSHRNHRGSDVLILQKQSGWPQRVSFEMFRMAGVPVPRTSWARLRINGCDYNNAVYEIERPGTDLARQWFGEVGDMFKSVGFTGDEGPWSWGDERLIQGSRNGFTQSQRYKHTYDRKTLGWKSDLGDTRADLVEPLVEGLHAARAAGPVALRGYLAEHFDVDLTLRYISTINYVGTFDDMFQNHFLYRKAEDGKWCVFPWDMDNTLGGAFGEATAHPFRGVDESRFGWVGNREGWWNRLKDSFFIAYPLEFQAMFHHLNNRVYSPAQMRPVVGALAAERGLGTSQVNGLMDHVQRRHDYLNQMLQVPDGAPHLTVRPLAGETVALSWSFEHFGWRLESASRLDGVWAPVTEPVVSRVTGHVVQLRVLGQRQFYRLARL